MGSTWLVYHQVKKQRLASSNEHITQTGSPGSFPIERKQRSMNNWQVTGLGQDRYNLGLEHLVPKFGNAQRMMGSCYKDK
jgi:hypothetical protein